jgi:hypothetical protein
VVLRLLLPLTAMLLVAFAGGVQANELSRKKPSTRTASATKKGAKKAGAKKRSKHRQGKRRRKHKAHKAKRKRRANAPSGWAWPPSKAMKKQGRACRERLTELGVSWKPAKRRRNIATPVVVPGMEFGGLKLDPKFRKPPFVMDCHLAKSLAEAGPALVAIGIKALRFSSIHSFRRARTHGKTKKTLSRHAYGLAVDVYEVDHESGERLVIQDVYSPMEEGEINLPDQGALLLSQLEREGNASGQFRLLLTPGNDPVSHYDHFHFEARVGDLAPDRRHRKKHKSVRKKRKSKTRIMAARKSKQK